MARAPGGTTCSSSGCGAASNTRRFISRPTIASARPALRSAATWTSTTAADRIRALTTPHPIKPTSTRCHSAWQPNPGRCSTYRRGDSVQTTGTTSVRDGLDQLLLREAIVTRANEMRTQLVRTIQSDQGADGDQAAVAL